ncbi:hypothetical protein V9T40_003566 [Parthenolecanium corni]|uniref:ER membrane protein complex subunit 7 beta-sandwich domain-containing protein n=1 Tax=Parthenolecanium corni TaxID=536013 RepID=A0AAN9TTH9_9HEMI
MKFALNFLCVCLVINVSLVTCAKNPEKLANLFDIEGVVYPPDTLPHNKKIAWLTETRVYLKGGNHVGFLRENGSFVLSKIRPGSYIVEVVSSNYVYEPIRIDVNNRGKFRARRINYVQSNQITPLPYPLKLKALGPARYFQVREQWRLIDLFFNPMVLMMILPLACIMLLPHVMNDPEAKKDMEQLQNLTKYDMPEVSEMITSFFSGSNEKQNCRPSKQSKKSKSS